MTRILIILSIIISIPNISFAAVVDACLSDTGEPIDADNCNAIAGCYWVEGSCEKCPDGKYGAGCTDSCPKSHPNTIDNGAQTIKECVFICQKEEITDKNGNPMGEKKPKQEYISFSRPNELPSCEYTISCYGKGTPGHTHPCTTYHLDQEEQTCEPDYKIVDYAGGYVDQCKRYFMEYENASYTAKSCTECNADYHLNPTEITDNCGIPTGNKCDANSISCATALKGEKISTTNTTGWRLSGPTNIQGDVFWDSTQYNYSNCSGEYTGTKMGETKKITCDGITYDPDSNTYKWNNCTLGTSTGCPDDKCIMPGKSNCGNADQGYYADGKNIACQSCPDGTTTDGTGKTGKSACQIKTGSSDQEPQTQFCDSTGNCFKLNTTVPQYFKIF